MKATPPMVGEGGTHGAGTGTAAGAAEEPLGAPGVVTLGGGGVLMTIVALEEAKDEAEESGSLAVQTSAIELCSDISAREKGELS